MLVTGGLGFIGIHLVNRLLKEGADVSVFARTIPKTPEALCILPKIKLIKGDLIEKENISKASQGIDYIFHLASSVPFSQKYTYSEELAENDLEIICSLVKSASREKVKKIIFISGFVVYGLPKETPIKESSPTEPNTLYGKNKLLCENQLKSECLKNKIHYVILRVSSCYGPYQYAKGLIPNFINSALHGSDLLVENKYVKRDYIYIDDLVDAFLMSLEAENKTYNIGGGKSWTVLQVANSIIDALKRGGLAIQNKPPPELIDNILDISLAKRDLGFSPKTALENGLKIQIDWKIRSGKKRIYFDLDGTLIDPSERLYSLHKNLLESLGVKTTLTKDGYISLKREKITEDEIVSGLLSKNKAVIYLQQRSNLIESPEYLSCDKLIPGVYELLKKLSKNFDLVLLTKRKSRENLLNQLEELKLKNLFNQILEAGLNADKSVILKQKYNVDSIIIGDTEDDFRVGKENGISVILVEWGLRSGKQIKKSSPHKTAKTLEELEKLVGQWGKGD